MRFRFDAKLGKFREIDQLCSVAAAIAGSAVVGAVGNVVSSSMASGAQQDAANNASNEQNQMFNIEQANLKPYMDVGASALPTLTSGTADYNSPLLKTFQPTEAELEATPGYQFNLSQGLKAVQNSATASGLGVSGNALAAAGKYATGLADSTYQNQFNNYVGQQTNQFNRLLSLANLGQNSAANVGQGAIQTGANIGSNIIGAGNAQAAGILGAGNAFASGAGGIGSGILLNNLLANNNNPSSGGGGGIYASPIYSDPGGFSNIG